MESNKLLPARISPDLVTYCNYTKLKHLCKKYDDQRSSQRRTLSLLCDSPGVQASLDKLRATSNEFEQLVMAFARDGISVDVTAESFDLLDTLDYDSAVLAKVDRVTLRKYARRLYSKHHPDRPGGNADIFNSIKSMEKAGHVEGLYLMLLDADFSDTQDSVLLKMLRSVQGKIDRLQSLPSWHIMYCLYAKGSAAAQAELIRQINSKTTKIQNQILGIG